MRATWLGVFCWAEVPGSCHLSAGGGLPGSRKLVGKQQEKVHRASGWEEEQE